MDEHVDWQQLVRYLAQECDPGEQRRFEAWIEAKASRRELVEALRRIWEAAGKPRRAASFDELDVEADWKQLMDKVRAQEQRQEQKEETHRPFASDRPPAPAPAGQHEGARTGAGRRARRSVSRAASSLQRVARPRTLARVAAVLVVLLGGALLIAQFSDGVDEPSEEVAYREVVSKRGERAHVQLTDGTQITLNVDSRLRIPERFGEGERAVELVGEAYFDVAADSSRPFVVHTRGAVVQVLGTAFGVRGYPEEQQVEVAVQEGAVSLGAEEAGAARAAMLRPGQLGRLSAGQEGVAQVDTEKVDLEAYLGWTEGRLVFEDASLPEVAARLERWYDIECEIRGDPDLASLRWTAALKSTSLRDVLDVIATSLSIRYQIEEGGQRVVLMSGET